MFILMDRKLLLGYLLFLIHGKRHSLAAQILAINHSVYSFLQRTSFLDFTVDFGDHLQKQNYLRSLQIVNLNYLRNFSNRFIQEQDLISEQLRAMLIKITAVKAVELP